ncbi:DUF2062 domain-containing protein [Oscillatoria sp. FACHB-1407]|uniref:DUF2062 domain-containing protein n=1 Tax=Oscillatoria sp. FACHB-1407 TaxID=2692847 RepID=UPI001687FC0D|nr:DUF2062 domain-containing protein [Oscillatoria sp. FACHB-1407]MBD2464410.1 DUF2062 domain-containing protein [Oscillatoria sp. FACHB-1407]
MKTSQAKWKRGLNYLWLRFLRLRATPNEISRGFAFGVFWGMFPLPGLQMATAILTAALFRSNKLAAAAGTWLTNPVTTLPFTALNLHVGQAVLGREWSELPSDLRSPDAFLALGSEMITSYLMGCFVVGLVAATISYLIGVPLVSLLQQRMQQRKLRRHRLKSSHAAEHLASRPLKSESLRSGASRSANEGSHHYPP